MFIIWLWCNSALDQNLNLWHCPPTNQWPHSYWWGGCCLFQCRTIFCLQKNKAQRCGTTWKHTSYNHTSQSNQTNSALDWQKCTCLLNYTKTTSFGRIKERNYPPSRSQSYTSTLIVLLGEADDEDLLALLVYLHFYQAFLILFSYFLRQHNCETWCDIYNKIKKTWLFPP